MKKILITLLYSLIIIISIIVIYCIAIFFEASHRTSTLNPRLIPTTENELQTDNILDRESIVKKNDLNTYMAFSTSRNSSTKWISEKVTGGDIKYLKDNEFLITNEQRLPDLVNNHCPALYCFQHRIPFFQIPPKLWKGLIGIEDFRYLSHQGVDIKSIFRAIWIDIKQRKLAQGGSTLTQQLVKNLFLTSEKTFSRKFKEMIYSVYIESKYSKEDILTGYLNEVYWGALQGIKIKGVYASSLFYFNKRPSEISAFEVAILIGLLKGPSYYNPLTQLKRLKKRTLIVYKQLFKERLIRGKIWSKLRWKNWQKHLLNLNKKRPYMAMWKLLNDKNVKNTYQNLAFFNSAIENILRLKETFKDKDIAIKAIVGIPSKKQDPPTISYYSKIERNKSKALKDEKQQIGSILKPILYSIFLEQGMTLSDPVSTGPITLKLLSGEWTPGEASPIKEEEISVIEAIRRSRNRPTIRLAQQVGFEVIEEKLLTYVENLKLPLAEYPAQLIGSLELSIHDVYNIYSKFILDQCIKFEGDISRSILKELSYPKLSTIRKMVGPRLKHLKFFGKTGTSNNGNDNWYISYDGVHLSVIWTGIESKREDKEIKLYGSTAAFPLYQSFIERRGRRFGELDCPNSLFYKENDSQN